MDTESAKDLLSKQQAIALACFGLAFVFGIVVFPLPFLRVVVAFITVTYAAIVAFKFFLGIHSLAISDTVTEPVPLSQDNLPVISVLCPLYREAPVVRRLIRVLSSLDWPTDKIEVLLLIRESDEETRSALRDADLPPQFRVITIFPEDYGTKPAALNVGLSVASGEYFIIYDAENGPDSNQLQRAASMLSRSPGHVAAVQCIPLVSNWRPKRSWQSIIARFQAAEYASHYDLLNPSLLTLGMPTPLPGNSVLFRTSVVRAIGLYDRYNKAEDADIAIRLARKGWKVVPLTSYTTEEAPTTYGSWERQRRRWIDGFIQTFVVHTKHPLLLLKELGLRDFLVFLATVGGVPFVLLLNPFLWTLTAGYWITRSGLIQELYPWPVLYLGLTSVLFGLFIFYYAFLIGTMKRQMYSNCLFMFGVPIYWFLMSVAAYRAAYDYVFAHNHWHKTEHIVSEPDSEQVVTL